MRETVLDPEWFVVDVEMFRVRIVRIVASRPVATGFRWPCSSRRGGPGGLRRCLPASTVLCLREDMLLKRLYVCSGQTS